MRPFGIKIGIDGHFKWENVKHNYEIANKFFFFKLAIDAIPRAEHKTLNKRILK